MFLSVLRKLKVIISKDNCVTKMTNNDILRELFRTSINSVQPGILIKNNIKVRGRHLTVKCKTYELKRPVRVVGFGKAVFGMAVSLENVLGKFLQGGIVSIPVGSIDSKQIPSNSKIEFIEGALHNLPDENAMRAASKIKDFLQDLDEDDIVIVLISGGGSALLPLPKGKILLSEKLDVVKKLGNRGANIFEMNCVRKELSELKGGGLAKHCFPAKVITLILSDVIGDPIDIIASGPTSLNLNTTNEAINILKKYSIFSTLQQSVRQTLEENLSTITKNSSLKKNPFIHVDHFIIGNNEIAARAAFKKAAQMGFQPILLSTSVGGNVQEISKIYGIIAKAFSDYLSQRIEKDDLLKLLLIFKCDVNLFEHEILKDNLENINRNQDICLILAGEPIVIVEGNGLGGRNQQLALSFSVELFKLDEIHKSADIWFLSCGTDGIDGPTDAAGAIGYLSLVRDAIEKTLDVGNYLKNNDCYNFYKQFEAGKYLVEIGHTGTNVMDIHIMLIRKIQ